MVLHQAIKAFFAFVITVALLVVIFCFIPALEKRYFRVTRIPVLRRTWVFGYGQAAHLASLNSDHGPTSTGARLQARAAQAQPSPANPSPGKRSLTGRNVSPNTLRSNPKGPDITLADDSPCNGIRVVQAEKKLGSSQRLLSGVTIVTAYYKIPNKRGDANYNAWMTNFLIPLRSPLHIFTDCMTLRVAKVFAALLDSREGLLEGRLHTDVLPMDKTRIARELGPMLVKQYAQDPERNRGHNYHLYLVWLMKAELLKIACEANVFGSDWFIYSDIGVFRAPHVFRDWPSPSRLDHLDKKRVLFEAIQPIIGGPKPTEIESLVKRGRAGFRLIYEDHLAGGYIGASSVHNVTAKFFSLVLETFNLLYKGGHLVVKDQVVYNAAFLRHPELFTVVPAQRFGDPWFYMNYWLANDRERGPAPDTPAIELDS